MDEGSPDAGVGRDREGLGDDVVAMRGFDAGGRVERTGIALVHEGEYVLPAVGSEALIAPADGTGTTVTYHFPIEIEVVGTLDEAAVRAVSDRVFAELARELDSRT
jgi:hypothetical protein